MSRSKQSQRISNGDWDALKNIAHELTELFELEGEWTTADAPGKWNMKSQAIIRKAVIHNALIQKGTTWVDRDDLPCHKLRKHVVYEWDQEVKQELMEYKEDLNELPCGCRAHIYNKPEGRYGCRYCDDERDYSKETVQKAIQ